MKTASIRRLILAAALACILMIAPAALGEHVPGLNLYPRITAEQAAQLPAQRGGILLTSGGVPLPYDSASATYFIPQSRAREAFDGEIRIEEQAGFSYSILEHEGFTKQTALNASVGLNIYAVGEENCHLVRVVFTPLPVICIDAASGSLPGEEAERGSIAVYTAKGGKIRREESPIEINLRGNTSKWLPKKSYRVKIIDEYGAKQDMDFPGLRSDDDWILNPMYADTSKIREALAYELWDEMNSVGQDAASSRIVYAEAIMNGAYWGLYGVQERIDRKQVDASKRTGLLYKVFANDRPTVQQLLDCRAVDICGGFEIKFAGEYASDLWAPAAAYMAFLSGEDGVQGANLSLRNVIDYGLWAMLVQAHDCHFKNQFLNCVLTDGGYVMYKIPWDLNNTFGDVWIRDGEAENYTGYHLGSLVMDGAFAKLVESKDADVYRAIVSRYRALREEVIDLERIVARARAIHEPIYAAIVRDGKRWPQSGMGDGNADNIRDIETSLYDIIYRMDKWVESLEQAI